MTSQVRSWPPLQQQQQQLTHMFVCNHVAIRHYNEISHIDVLQMREGKLLYQTIKYFIVRMKLTY